VESFHKACEKIPPSEIALATEQLNTNEGVGSEQKKAIFVTDIGKTLHQAKKYLFTKHNHTDYRLIVISCKFLPARRRKEKSTIALSSLKKSGKRASSLKNLLRLACLLSSSPWSIGCCSIVLQI